MDRIFRLVEALMVLHNIFLDLNDSPEELEDFDPADPDADAMLEELLETHGRRLDDRHPDAGNAGGGNDANETAQQLRAGGQALRQGIMEALGLYN
jgi:hypothetical protein